ncbi:hypothetical protein [Aeromonas hydrophila]|uniref:hypothetical protein n=1 Tax=Aeromonas hydrophila TaxID=644 RepID=UPI001655F042|nr:hypothetical protein [Aeromonas hydrophila]MBC8670865.1 hypothetical protein [Aeromonas hydrophila]MBC8690844.1 hypothetical protein [Aeromonas hydrophila]HAU4888781.1 hypothetical protein [Aeromonas hydrophila]
MSTLSKVMGIVGLLLVLALYVTHRRNVDMQRTLGEQQTTITHLQTVNSQQATELQEQQLMTTSLRLLLNDQNAALADLDNQNRKTADELQQALATPPAGRPDCAREPLPSGALRLLQPAHHGGANQGSEAAAAARAGAPLPGA